MNKKKCAIIDLYQLVTLTGVAFATWKIAHHWHAGLAEKTGHAIDASIGAAAEKLEKTAIALEEWADKGLGEKLGKGLDVLLTDAKISLETATELVRRAEEEIAVK
jgi:phosphoribosyl-dephospho-CoA transferase